MRVIKILFILYIMAVLLAASSLKAIGFLTTQQDVAFLRSSPVSLLQEKDPKEILYIIPAQTMLEILSYGYGKDFMYFEVRTQQAKIGYVIFDGFMDYRWLTEKNIEAINNK